MRAELTGKRWPWQVWRQAILVDLKRVAFFQAFMRAQLGAIIAEEEQHQREKPRLIMTPAEAMRAQQAARSRQRMR